MTPWYKNPVALIVIGVLLYLAVNYGIAILVLIVTALAFLYAMIEKILFAAAGVALVIGVLWLIFHFRKSDRVRSKYLDS